jgi:hypothetical protein
VSKPYGRIIGGGVSAVMDTSTAEEVHHAADAFDYFGLGDLAALTRRLAGADCSDDSLDEHRLNLGF